MILKAIAKYGIIRLELSACVNNNLIIGVLGSCDRVLEPLVVLHTRKRILVKVLPDLSMRS